MSPAPVHGQWPSNTVGEREIRLLTFFGKGWTGTLTCQLDVVSLADSSIDYHALSYVWGKNTVASRRKIRCNDRTVSISENLYDALAQLWRQFPRRKIWVDAICINQQDEVEKTAQIALMGSIYGRASSVMIWLGRQMEGIDTAQLFSWLNQDAPYDPPPKCQSCRDQFEGRCDHISQSKAEREKYRRVEWLNAIPQNAWFERMWTFQELCLAQAATLHLGSCSLEWTHFVRIVRRLGRFPINVVQKSREVRLLDELRVERGEPRETETLEHVMVATRFRKMTEPRDRIRAILGILPSSRYNTLMRTEVGQSAALLYAEAARILFHDEDRINILFSAWPFHGISSPNISNLPSWCPNWQDSECLVESALFGPTPQRFIPHLDLIMPELSTAHQPGLSLQVCFIAIGVFLPAAEAGGHPDNTQPDHLLTSHSDTYLAAIPSCFQHHEIFISSHDTRIPPAETGRHPDPNLFFSVDTIDPESTATAASTLSSILSTHRAAACRCCSPAPPLDWSQTTFASAPHPGDWLGILTNRSGHMSSMLVAARPSSSGTGSDTGTGTFTLTGYTRYYSTTYQVEYERTGKFICTRHAYLLTHMVLE